jgi:hypothetical protein
LGNLSSIAQNNFLKTHNCKNFESEQKLKIELLAKEKMGDKIAPRGTYHQQLKNLQFDLNEKVLFLLQFPTKPRK